MNNGPEVLVIEAPPVPIVTAFRAEPVVEALVQRVKSFVHSRMPFADQCRRIVVPFEYFSHRDPFVEIEALSIGVPAGHQSAAARSTP